MLADLGLWQDKITAYSTGEINERQNISVANGFV
jgi:hypothetical protein